MPGLTGLFSRMRASPCKYSFVRRSFGNASCACTGQSAPPALSVLFGFVSFLACSPLWQTVKSFSWLSHSTVNVTGHTTVLPSLPLTPAHKHCKACRPTLLPFLPGTEIGPLLNSRHWLLLLPLALDHLLLCCSILHTIRLWLRSFPATASRHVADGRLSMRFLALSLALAPLPLEAPPPCMCGTSTPGVVAKWQHGLRIAHTCAAQGNVVSDNKTRKCCYYTMELTKLGIQYTKNNNLCVSLKLKKEKE